MNFTRFAHVSTRKTLPNTFTMDVTCFYPLTWAFHTLLYCCWYSSCSRQLSCLFCEVKTGYLQLLWPDRFQIHPQANRNNVCYDSVMKTFVTEVKTDYVEGCHWRSGKFSLSGIVKIENNLNTSKKDILLPSQDFSQSIFCGWANTCSQSKLCCANFNRKNPFNINTNSHHCLV